MPLCFILMPFGQKPDATGFLVNFDKVYEDLIKPAVIQAGLDPIRADEEQVGGIIHKPMFERLILCEFAIADLTTANANVFYELGVRHTARPWSTVLLFAGQSRLPFDVAPLRAMPYKLTPAGLPDDIPAAQTALVKSLESARQNARAFEQGGYVDSPVFQLVEGFPNRIAHEKTDSFRAQCQIAAQYKDRLALARAQNIDAVRAIETELGDLQNAEAGVLIDLFLSYRAHKGWTDMIALVDKMPAPLSATVMVQEQLALALNREKQSDKAELILLDLIKNRGHSSETCGILGRVYKDRWAAARARGDNFAAAGLLDKAIATYTQGFEADWRDAFPGVNAVTLMTIRNPPDPRRDQILPVVSYAVEQRIATGKPDYWDFATRLELAVLAKDQTRATQAAGDALACVREKWEPETTANNLRYIREARAERGETLAWATEIEQALHRKANET